MAGRRREEETEDAVAAADEKALEKFDKVEKPKVRVSEVDDREDEEIEIDPPEDDDEPELEPEPRPGRQERRRQRGRDRDAERDRVWQERLDAQERAAAEQRALFAGLINQVRQQAPQQSQADPEEQKLKDEIKGLEKQRRGLIDRHQQLSAAKQLDQATHDRMQDEDFELRQEIARKQHQLFSPRQQQAGLTAQQVQALNNQQRLRQDHGDVVSNPVAFAYFQGAYQELRTKFNAPESWETVEKAMAKSRQLAGLPPKGGRPAPSAGVRSKFEGAPRGGGTGGGGERTTVRLTKEMRELADAAYPHLKPEKRYQHYVNKHGKSKTFQGA